MKHLRTTLKFAVAVAALLTVATGIMACTGQNGDSWLEKIGIHIEPGDTVPPTIQVFPMQANVGETPDFMKNVVASDSCSSVTIKVDSTTYNINAAGDYMVTYTATDSAGNVATAQAPLKVIDENTKIIYLTFDDGPSNNTGRILKILEQEGAKATFFVTAQFKDHLHFIKDEFEAGHAIAAHTYSHAFSIYRSIDTYFEDLERIEQIIEAQTGQRTKIIRFPGGSNNTVNRRYAKRNIMPELIKEVLKRGYQYVDWNLDSTDAAGVNRPASVLIANACNAHSNQLCLLMHDTDAKNTTVEALPTIIRYFKDQGYAFGTITSTGYVCHFSTKYDNID